MPLPPAPRQPPPKKTKTKTAPQKKQTRLPLFELDLRALDTAVGDLERTHAALRAQLAREREAAARLAKLLGEGGAAAAQGRFRRLIFCFFS